MNIFAHPSNRSNLLTEFMDFNRISYSIIDLYDNSTSTFKIPPLPGDRNLLIIDFFQLVGLSEHSTSYTSLIDFVSNPKNLIWVFDSYDFLIQVIKHHSIFNDLDCAMKHQNITLYLEALPTDDCFLKKLKNIQVNAVPYNWFMNFPRIQRSLTDKSNCKNNFLLTMVRKEKSVHRDLLWEKLNLKPHLLDTSISVYHIMSYDTHVHNSWVGEMPHQNNWPDGYPSMDLYSDCWFEIVPETLYQFGYFITEKTIKPIATKTPFLILSSPGYLKFLQNLGFRTFHNLIDESYDTIENLNDRVSAIVKQVEIIVQNGSENFYRESLDITTHNQNRLLEITGRYQFDIDLYLNQQFSNLKI